METTMDHGYAWVVCAALFVQRFLCCLVVYGIGMFYILFKRSLQGNSSVISFVSVSNNAAMYTVAPVASILISKFSVRKVSLLGTLLTSAGLILASQATHAYQMCLTFGVLAGAGQGIQEIAGLKSLTEYFDKQLGLATGIATSASSVGAIVAPYLITHLNDVYGWRGTLLILGGVELQSLVCGALYRTVTKMSDNESSPEMQCNPDKLDINILDTKMEYEGETHSNIAVRPKRFIILVDLLKKWLSVFKTPIFSIFCASEFFFMMAVSIVYTHIGAYIISQGFTQSHAALFFIVLAVAGTITRVLSGFATQIPRCNPLYICLSSLLLGCATIAFSFYNTMSLILMYAALFGSFISPYNILPVTILTELFKKDKVAISLGLMHFFFGPAYLLGGPIAGWLFDFTGTYLYSFYLATALMFVAGILDVICIWLRHH